jgi:hypothetical protein
MIDRAHDLPITKQAKVLRISRGSVYYLPRPVIFRKDKGVTPTIIGKLHVTHPSHEYQ